MNSSRRHLNQSRDSKRSIRNEEKRTSKESKASIFSKSGNNFRRSLQFEPDALVLNKATSEISASEEQQKRSKSFKNFNTVTRKDARRTVDEKINKQNRQINKSRNVLSRGDITKSSNVKKTSTSNLSTSANLKFKERTSISGKISISQKRSSLSSLNNENQNMSSIQKIVDLGLNDKNSKEQVKDFIH